MKEAIKKLSNKHIRFICDECSITENELLSMDDDELYDRVYVPMCEIEIDEVCNNSGEEETERCEIASDIVTVLGNTLGKAAEE